jgi:hypothetical protein
MWSEGISSYGACDVRRVVVYTRTDTTHIARISSPWGSFYFVTYRVAWGVATQHKKLCAVNGSKKFDLCAEGN